MFFLLTKHSMHVSKTLLKQIPNLLTSFRIILIVPFIIAFNNLQYVNCFYIFLIASFTDGLDGWLARHYRWHTPLGSFLDPAADKLIVAASFILLALIHKIPWWLFILVFMRDATIAAGILFWSLLIHEKLVFSPTMMSKINTTLQLLLVVFCLFELAYTPFKAPITHVLITLTAITTSLTYLHYVWVWGVKAWCFLKHHQHLDTSS